MDKRSAMIIAGTLVAAMMAGIVSREITLGGSRPTIQIVQSNAPAAPASPSAEQGER